MSAAATNRELIEGFWRDLYEQDFEALVRRFLPDGQYTDVATPDDDIATGSEEITARLTLAFGRLSSLTDERLHLVAGDEAVITEHIEHWAWPTGETMALQVASVHEIKAGAISMWRDYWDMNLLVNSAPQWWFEHVMQGWK